MSDWIDGSKLGSDELSRFGLRDKDKLHEESRYVLIVERTLLDLIIGIREMFKDTTATMLYHIFKKAAERKTKSLLRDMESYRKRKVKAGEETYSKHVVDEMVLKEALKQLQAEGYCQEYSIEVKHVDKKVLIKTKQPLSLRLGRLAEEIGLPLTEEEISAISRGLISGVLSSITGLDVDVKNFVLNKSAKESTYILPTEVYEKMFLHVSK